MIKQAILYPSKPEYRVGVWGNANTWAELVSYLKENNYNVIQVLLRNESAIDLGITTQENTPATRVKGYIDADTVSIIAGNTLEVLYNPKRMMIKTDNLQLQDVKDILLGKKEAPKIEKPAAEVAKTRCKQQPEGTFTITEEIILDIIEKKALYTVFPDLEVNHEVYMRVVNGVKALKTQKTEGCKGCALRRIANKVKSLSMPTVILVINRLNSMTSEEYNRALQVFESIYSAKIAVLYSVFTGEITPKTP